MKAAPRRLGPQARLELLVKWKCKNRMHRRPGAIHRGSCSFHISPGSCLFWALRSSNLARSRIILHFLCRPGSGNDNKEPGRSAVSCAVVSVFIIHHHHSELDRVCFSVKASRAWLGKHGLCSSLVNLICTESHFFTTSNAASETQAKACIDWLGGPTWAAQPMQD